MQKTKTDIWQKITMAIFAMGPILAWYKIPFPVSLGYTLILFVSFFLIVRSSFNIKELPKTFFPIFLYICGLWVINHNFALWTLLPPGGWMFFIFVLGIIGGVKGFNIELLKKYMKWIVWIAIPLFWIQFILLKTTGSQQICFVPHLTPEFTYEDLSYAELVGRHLASDYPCSIFLEKSYMAYYLVAYLCQKWFDKTSQKLLNKEVAIIVFTLISLRSGSGIVGLSVILVVKLFSLFWTQNSSRRFVMIFLLVPFVTGVFYLYQSTESGQEILSRQEEFSRENSSGYVRVLAGYYMFDMMTPQEKLIGKPDAREAFGMLKSDGTIKFYTNGVQTILIGLGYIGVLLYLLFYGSVFRRVSLESRMSIIILLTMGLLESNYLNPFMILLTVIPCGELYNLKRVGF